MNMVRNEPSDRRDRAIQRMKMRQMWESLNEEKARMAMLPGNNPKTVHYIGRGGEDVTAEFDRAMLWVIGALAVISLIICMTV
jgi:hypothetical protein